MCWGIFPWDLKLLGLFRPVAVTFSHCCYFLFLNLREDHSVGNIQVISTMIRCHLRYRFDYKCLGLLVDYVCVSRVASELTFKTVITESIFARVNYVVRNVILYLHF